MDWPMYSWILIGALAMWLAAILAFAEAMILVERTSGAAAVWKWVEDCPSAGGFSIIHWFQAFCFAIGAVAGGALHWLVT
jgi:hypothetical protein